jgi:hypothetical protein
MFILFGAGLVSMGGDLGVPRIGDDALPGIDGYVELVYFEESNS